MIWSVWQTGGRRHTYWHLVFRGSEAEAREKYESMRTALRRGGIQLRDGSGVVVATNHTTRARII